MICNLVSKQALDISQNTDPSLSYLHLTFNIWYKEVQLILITIMASIRDEQRHRKTGTILLYRYGTGTTKMVGKKWYHRNSVRDHTGNS